MECFKKVGTFASIFQDKTRGQRLSRKFFQCKQLHRHHLLCKFNVFLIFNFSFDLI